METKKVLAARIYITESSPLVHQIVNYLHYEAKIRGVSVFRAISGFGDTGEHSASLLDLSLELPLAIDFVDSKEKMEPALKHLSDVVKVGHLIFWEADGNWA